MQINQLTQLKDLSLKRANCEFQLGNFFKHYPMEFVKESLAQLFARILPNNDAPNYSYLFYQELNLMLANSEMLHKFSASSSICAVVDFIKESIPAAYIFCNLSSASRTDLIIVMDRHDYKPFEEIYSLLDFAVLGHRNINCTVHAFGTMYDFLLKGHIFYSSLCTPENCVYNRYAHFDLPILLESRKMEIIESSSKLFNQSMGKATTFYNGAIQFTNESESTIAAFMLQQACELSFRSLLLSLRGKEVKCHSLVVLRKHLSHFFPSIIGILADDEETEIKILESIQDAYIRSRYDHCYKVSLAELLGLIKKANLLMTRTREIFNYHCLKLSSTTYKTMLETA